MSFGQLPRPDRAGAAIRLVKMNDQVRELAAAERLFGRRLVTGVDVADLREAIRDWEQQR